MLLQTALDGHDLFIEKAQIIQRRQRRPVAAGRRGYRTVRVKVLQALCHRLMDLPLARKAFVEPHRVARFNGDGVGAVRGCQRGGAGDDEGPLGGVVPVVFEVEAAASTLVRGRVPYVWPRGSG